MTLGYRGGAILRHPVLGNSIRARNLRPLPRGRRVRWLSWPGCRSSSSTRPTRPPPTSRRRSRRWPRGSTRRSGADAARRHRHRQDLHDGGDDRAGAAPALVIAHNKTLAAQLCNEFREFFPDNAVEYFVSYYDYYQPEAYVPAQDLYIEKDSSINDEIDRLRHAATASLFARDDVIIVASVSCIYGIGSPELYKEQMQLFKVGDWIDRTELFRKLVGMQYRRNDTSLGRGTFRVRGEVLEIYPAYAESAYRIQLFGDEIEAIQHFDPLTGEILDAIDHVSIWPASHYVVQEETMERAVDEIEQELLEQVAHFEEQRQAARGAPAPAAHPLRHGDDARARLLPGDRELLADPRRPPAGQPAVHADRLLPGRLRRLHRRVPPDHPAARRHVRGRLLAQVDPGRLRLPAALGDRQPAAQVRRVPRPGRPDGAGLGDARARGSAASPRGSSSRSSGRRGSSTRRSRSARPRTRSTT